MVVALRRSQAKVTEGIGRGPNSREVRNPFNDASLRLCNGLARHCESKLLVRSNSEVSIVIR